MNGVYDRQWRASLSMLAIGVGLALMTLLALGTTAALAADASTDAANEAHVVVQLDGTDLLVRPITFTESISGFRALQLSGLDFAYSTEYGPPLVCSIEGVGCPADDCFCDPDGKFWAYSQWNGSDWEPSMVGAGSSVISQTGAVEGWRWGGGSGPWASAEQAQAAQRGLAVIQAGQSITDGSYGGSMSSSLEAMLAVGANNLAADEWRAAPGAPSLMDFVTFAARGYTWKDVSAAGKAGVALTGADGCLPPGMPYPSEFYSPTLGAMSDQPGFLSWAILGSVALSEPVAAGNVDYLRGMIQPDGGWEWSPTWGTDTNTTALALQALLAAGVPVSATEIVSGVAYLQAAQNDDGGFPYQPGSPFGSDSDANSTAWAVQGLLAAGEDVTAAQWAPDGASPIDFLLDMQLPDGSFEWMKGAGFFATEQAVAALLGGSYPLQVRALDACSVHSTYLPYTCTSRLDQ